LISLTENDIKEGIKKVVKEKYWDINEKAIDFATHYAQRK
jgi:Pyruvate/2-oxoacid:ferredoxin oxidoreductase gamma subunit